MSDGHINMEKLMKLSGREILPTPYVYTIIRNRILNTCADQGKDIN